MNNIDFKPYKITSHTSGVFNKWVDKYNNLSGFRLIVKTPMGLVDVYCDYTVKDGALFLDFVYGGYSYTRSITGKKYTIIGAARIAGRYAKDVVKGKLES